MAASPLLILLLALLVCLLICVVVQQLLNKVHMSEKHTPAAVSIQAQHVQSLSAAKTSHIFRVGIWHDSNMTLSNGLEALRTGPDNGCG